MKASRSSASRHRGILSAALALSLLTVAGCVNVTTGPQASLPPLPPLVTAGAEHYTIRSEGSDVRFLVYRAGPLAAFGHNHVIHAATLQGDVYLNRQFSLSGFSITLPVKAFRVDEPAERAAEGADFAVQPSAAAVSGTSSNMFGPALLDAAHFPEIVVRSVRISGPQSDPVVTVRITLHGIQRELDVPITLATSGSQLMVSCSFDVKQTDFGIAPFSILGGGLQVADTVKVHLRIVAERD
ncbi:MAG: YceI family protein [Gammaproteobacteria bacterium]